jgi:hypothetical protein
MRLISWIHPRGSKTPSILFLSPEQMHLVGHCIKIGRAWAILGGYGEPLEDSASAI